MPRKLLLFAALAVAGSMLVLWLVTRDKQDESSASPSEDTVADSRSPARDRTRPALPGDPSQPSAPVTEDNLNPSAPRNTDPRRPQAGTVESVERGTNANKVTEPPLEYTLPDGRRVRDFRDPDKRKPLEMPPSIHPPGGRRIKPELTGLFTDQILAHMKECGKAVPQTALGPKPRLEGQIVIAIKQQQGSVTSALFKLNDVASDSVAATARQCIEQKALTVKVPADGEIDLESYSINLSFAFP